MQFCLVKKYEDDYQQDDTNIDISSKIVSLFKYITPSDYHYVKFSDTHNSEYYMVCDMLVYHWLDNFSDAQKIKNDVNTISETYNGKQIINYLKLEDLNTFKIIYKQLCSGINPEFNNKDDIIKYLFLLYQLTSLEKLLIIIDNINIPVIIWMELKNIGCNIIQNFNTKLKFEMTNELFNNNKNFIIKWFNCIGMPWIKTKKYFEHEQYPYPINISPYDKYHRIYDKESNMCYNIVFFACGNKNYGILFNKTPFEFVNEERITYNNQEITLYHTKQFSVDVYDFGVTKKMLLFSTFNEKKIEK